MPTSAQKIAARWLEAGGAVSMRHVSDILKGAHDIVLAQAGPNQEAVTHLTKMMIRFQQNLERRGIRLRDPKALAEDLLYAADIEVSWDLNRAADIINGYASGADVSDLVRSAAADVYVYVENTEGYLTKFEGPMSRGQAKKKEQKYQDDDGVDSVTTTPASSIKRNLGSASKSYFSKLPKADKSRLDKAIA